MTRITLTLIVPASLIPAANELACIGGISEADRNTFRAPAYEAGGVQYAVSNFTAEAVWVETMTGPLWEPEWGADLTLAQEAQDALDFGSDEAEPVPSASTISVYQGDDYARYIQAHLTRLAQQADI